MGKPIERDFTQSKGILRKLQRQEHHFLAMMHLAKDIFWKMLT